jgi:hypothetical protein
MAQSGRRQDSKAGEGIVGVRVPAAVIADLKAEARRRKIQELWAG